MCVWCSQNKTHGLTNELIKHVQIVVIIMVNHAQKNRAILKSYYFSEVKCPIARCSRSKKATSLHPQKQLDREYKTESKIGLN